jgi:hypothetical protein
VADFASAAPAYAAPTSSTSAVFGDEAWFIRRACMRRPDIRSLRTHAPCMHNPYKRSLHKRGPCTAAPLRFFARLCLFIRSMPFSISFPVTGHLIFCLIFHAVFYLIEYQDDFFEFYH